MSEIKNEQTDLSYTGTTGVALGGIPAGRVYTNRQIRDLVVDALNPYVMPAFTSFSITGLSNPLEVGANISGAKTFTWGTVNNGGSIATNSISILDITGSATLFTGLANDGSEPYTFATPVTRSTPGSYVWQIQGQDIIVPANTFTRNLTENWYWRVYSGMNTNVTLTNAQILALANTFLTTTFPVQVSTAGGGYFHFLVPTTFTQPTTFKNHATGFSIDMNDPVVVSVTNANSIVQNYNDYCSTQIQNSTTLVDIS